MTASVVYFAIFKILNFSFSQTVFSRETLRFLTDVTQLRHLLFFSLIILVLRPNWSLTSSVRWEVTVAEPFHATTSLGLHWSLIIGRGGIEFDRLLPVIFESLLVPAHLCRARLSFNVHNILELLFLIRGFVFGTAHDHWLCVSSWLSVTILHWSSIGHWVEQLWVSLQNAGFIAQNIGSSNCVTAQSDLLNCFATWALSVLR